MRYLELGYGQGFSLNAHAATDQEAEFWGTDFLPEQALNARTLALEAGLGTKTLNYSFAELDDIARAGKLPAFDIIVFHGIWSWINKENQRHILNIIDTCLKPGGIVYVSYNAMPGRATLMPVRELMVLHTTRKSPGKDSLTQAREAAQFVQALEKAGAAFFGETPACQGFVKAMETQPSSYLAHEYLNQDWHAPYIAEIANDMTAAKCYFVTSSRPLEGLDLAQPENTLDILKAIPDAVSREMIRSFNLNQGFRTDIFLKPGSFLGEDEHKARINQAGFAMMAPLMPERELAIRLPLDEEANLGKDLYYPILEVLAENSYEPKTLAFLHSHPRLEEMAYGQLLFCINILCGGGYISLATPAPSEKTRAACQRLNRIQCEKTATGDLQDHLVSPVLGCAMWVAEHHQFFLLSLASGKKTPAALAKDTFAAMQAQGKSLRSKNNSPQKPKSEMEVFLSEANMFNRVFLPWFKAMGITLSPQKN